MKKKTLKEELIRIHTLTYGPKILSEDSFLDRVLSFVNGDKKTNEPGKAEYVSSDVQDFYNTLGQINTPLTQEPYGSMTYKKEIETVQIGLILLGYELPRFGVDGLFGPETATAVNKFKSDNNVNDNTSTVNESILINEDIIESPLTTINVTSPFGENRNYESHPGVDLSAQSGSQVNSPADGVITNAGFAPNGCGGTVTIKHTNGFQSRFCHLKEIFVNQGQSIKQGDKIALTGGAQGDKGAGNATGPHLHFELKKNGQLVNPMTYIGQNVTNTNQNVIQSDVATITPNMVKIMIEKLKTRNVTSDDLKKYLDPITSGGNNLFTDLDLTTNDGYRRYMMICQTFINRKNPNSHVTGIMLANAARRVFIQYHKYLPPELALSQLDLEGGLSTNQQARPIRTNNPFDVGNTATNSETFKTIDDGVNAYYNLIAKTYLGNGKNASDLINNFVNHNGDRYANPENYETYLNRIALEANKLAKTIG